MRWVCARESKQFRPFHWHPGWWADGRPTASSLIGLTSPLTVRRFQTLALPSFSPWATWFKPSPLLRLGSRISRKNTGSIRVIGSLTARIYTHFKTSTMVKWRNLCAVRLSKGAGGLAISVAFQLLLAPLSLLLSMPTHGVAETLQRQGSTRLPRGDGGSVSQNQPSPAEVIVEADVKIISTAINDLKQEGVLPKDVRVVFPKCGEVNAFLLPKRGRLLCARN